MDTQTDDDTELLQNAQLALWMGARLIDYAWYDGTRRPFLWWPDTDPPRGDDFQRLPNGWYCEWNSIPDYGADWAAAGELQDALVQAGYELTLISPQGPPLPNAEWRCNIAAPIAPTRLFPRITAQATTGPLAIRKAAWRAVTVTASFRQATEQTLDKP
jgi:hypothetical protein